MAYTRNIIILIFFFLVPASMVNGQWKIERAPVTMDLNAIAMLSQNSGWIVGDKGSLIFRYKDVWMKYPNITDKDLFSICLTDRNNGWAVGAYGTILHFNGTKWDKYDSPTKEDLYSVSFRDPSHGIAVGTRGSILLYENKAWKLTNSGTQATLYTVHDRKDISIAGGGLEFFNMPLLKIEENPQYSLTEVFKPGYHIIKSICASHRNFIWAVGLSGTIFHFNGIQWKSVKPFEKIPTLNSIFFSGDKKGLAAGYGGVILTYSDETWQMEVSPVTVKLNGTAVIGNTYYAVGNDGTIITLTRNPEFIPNTNTANPSTVKVETFPNPSSTYICITIPNNGNFPTTNLTVINSQGHVSMVKKIILVSGDVYEISTNELNNGLYLLIINFSDGKTATGKFIVKH